MSPFAGLVELIDGSRLKWSTLRCRGHEWRHWSGLNEAFLGSVPQGAVVAAAVVSDEPRGDETKEPWRLWVDASDRIRTEFAVGFEAVAAVIDGPTWWSWTPSGGALTNGGDDHSTHGVGPGALLIEPSWRPAIEMEMLGHVRVADRTALRILAHPAPVDGKDRDPFDPRWMGLHELGQGADEYEIAIDEERGTLLRCEAGLGGDPFRIVQVDEINFDEDLSPDTFVLAPPGGEAFTFRKTRPSPLISRPARHRE